jgi:hypothetical protein
MKHFTTTGDKTMQSSQDLEQPVRFQRLEQWRTSIRTYVRRGGYWLHQSLISSHSRVLCVVQSLEKQELVCRLQDYYMKGSSETLEVFSTWNSAGIGRRRKKRQDIPHIDEECCKGDGTEQVHRHAPRKDTGEKVTKVLKVTKVAGSCLSLF